MILVVGSKGVTGAHLREGDLCMKMGEAARCSLTPGHSSTVLGSPDLP